LRYGGEISDNISYRVYGTAFKRDNTIFADSIEAEDDWQMSQVGARLDWSVAENSALTFQSNFYDGRPDPDGGKPVEAKGFNISGQWNKTISERSDFEIHLYYDETSRDFRNGFAENLKSYDLEGQHHFDLGSKHKFVYGAGFRVMDHSVTNLELFAFTPAQKSLFLFNLFLQDNISLIEDKLTLTAGIKTEHYTYSDFQVQPNLRLNWIASPTQSIWAAVSRAVRNPSRIDREFSLSIAPGIPFIVGSETKPEELLAYELGWHFQPAGSISLGLATYYNKYDDLRGVEPGQESAPFPLVFSNTVQGSSYGAEFSCTYQPADWWRLRGGYNYLHKDLSVKPGRSDANNASAESNDATHQAMVQSMMDLTSKTSVGLLLRYVGDLPKPKVEGYVGLDVRFAYRPISNLELSIVGQNLLQESHVEFIPTAPPVKAFERSVYFKVTARF
jgi:iron complex outermembrane receptor protein